MKNTKNQERREATAKRIAEIMRAQGFTLLLKMADKTANTWFDKYRHDASGVAALVEIFADGDGSEIYTSRPDGNTWGGAAHELKLAIERTAAVGNPNYSIVEPNTPTTKQEIIALAVGLEKFIEHASKPEVQSSIHGNRFDLALAKALHDALPAYGAFYKPHATA